MVLPFNLNGIGLIPMPKADVFFPNMFSPDAVMPGAYLVFFFFFFLAFCFLLVGLALGNVNSGGGGVYDDEIKEDEELLLLLLELAEDIRLDSLLLTLEDLLLIALDFELNNEDIELCFELLLEDLLLKELLI